MDTQLVKAHQIQAGDSLATREEVDGAIELTWRQVKSVHKNGRWYTIRGEDGWATKVGAGTSFTRKDA